MNNSRDFVKKVTDSLGGVTVVLEYVQEIRTRGFDAQLPLKKTYKGVNTIKVTNENNKLEVVFYKIIPKKYIMQKVATVEIGSLADLKQTIKTQIGLEFK